MDPSNIKVKITSEQNKSIDDIVREADIIWKDVRRRKLQITNTDATSLLLKEMQEKHPKFCQAYPVVNRYICQMLEYDSKTFRLWLEHIQLHPWKTTEEYIEAQADYITRLFRHAKPRSNTTEISNVRNNVYNMLLEEHNHFKNCAEKTQSVVEKNEKYLKSKNADELFNFAKVAGVNGIALAETYRVDVSECAGSDRLDFDVFTRTSGAKNNEPCGVCADDLLI